MSATDDSVRQRQWFIVMREQSFAGEMRVNIIRLVGLAVFFTIHLLRHFVFDQEVDAADRDFHWAVCWVVAGWTLMAVTILACLARRVFPTTLKYYSTIADLALLTAICCARSSLTDKTAANDPLVLVFFLVIVLAGLRVSLPLIWMATALAAVGFMMVVGASDDQWFDANHSVPVAAQLTTLAGLVLTGVTMGQMVRRTRVMADRFAQRLAAHTEGAAS